MYLRLRRSYLFEKDSLGEEIKLKNTSLTNFAISISNNLRFTENIKENIKMLKKNLTDPLLVEQLECIENQVLVKLQAERDKKDFHDKVKETYESFYDNLDKSFPNLSKSEKQLAAFLRLTFPPKKFPPCLTYR